MRFTSSPECFPCRVQTSVFSVIEMLETKEDVTVGRMDFGCGADQTVAAIAIIHDCKQACSVSEYGVEID